MRSSADIDGYDLVIADPSNDRLAILLGSRYTMSVVLAGTTGNCSVVRHMKVVLPISQKNAILLRIYRAVDALASWCTWRCPVGAFVMVIAGLLFSAPWWQTICFTATSVLIALLFLSFGLYGALTSLMLERDQRWFEYVGMVCGILGGGAFTAIGLLGSWLFFRSAVLGL